MHLLRKRLLRRSTQGELLNGSWTSLKMKQTIIAEPFTHKTRLSLSEKERRLFKYNVIVDVMNEIIFYTGGVLVRLCVQKGEGNNSIRHHSTGTNSNKKDDKDEPLYMGEGTSMSTVSESERQFERRSLILVTENHVFTTAHVTQTISGVTMHAFILLKSRCSARADDSPMCPGIASASLCIRVSRV